MEGVGVDLMAQAGNGYALTDDTRRRKHLYRRHHAVERRQRVLLAMNEHDRRLRYNFVVQFICADEAAGIAEHGGRRDGAAEAQMQCHHRALAEADKRKAFGPEIVCREFGVEKCLERGCCGDRVVIKARVAGGALANPLEAAVFRRRQSVRRGEGDARHRGSPVVGEGHQLGTGGTVAVQEDDQPFGLA